MFVSSRRDQCYTGSHGGRPSRGRRKTPTRPGLIGGLFYILTKLRLRVVLVLERRTRKFPESWSRQINWLCAQNFLIKVVRRAVDVMKSVKSGEHLNSTVEPQPIDQKTMKEGIPYRIYAVLMLLIMAGPVFNQF